MLVKISALTLLAVVLQNPAKGQEGQAPNITGEMDSPYIPLLSGFLGAVVGAAASVITIGVQGRHWLRQQRWNNRERHYTELLSSLSRLKLSLLDRHGYYVEPGSEHDPTIPEDDGFKQSAHVGDEAMQAIRQQFGSAAAFL